MKPAYWLLEGRDANGHPFRHLMDEEPKGNTWSQVTPLYTEHALELEAKVRKQNAKKSRTKKSS
jgi:hypothetical protein